MKRRSVLMLTGMALLGLAIASFPQVASAQSNPMIGTWKLNIDKSKFTPGAALRSGTINSQPDGQNIRNTAQAIDSQGNQTTTVFMHIYDGQPHPTTGASDFDASTYTRVDANTVILGRFKAGKLVAVGTGVVTPDGKMLTFTTTGTGSTAASATGITVWDKQ